VCVYIVHLYMYVMARIYIVHSSLLGLGLGFRV
jgi:hypothetical protein